MAWMKRDIKFNSVIQTLLLRYTKVPVYGKKVGHLVEPGLDCFIQLRGLRDGF